MTFKAQGFKSRETLALAWGSLDLRAGVMPNARGRSLRLVFELVELMSTLTLRCTCSGLCNPHACARAHHCGCHTIAIASDVDKFKVCNELWHAHVWAALQELTAFKGRTGISLVPVFTPERPMSTSCSASACEQLQLAVCVVVAAWKAARAAPPWPGVGAAGAAHVHAGSTDLLVDTARTATASVFATQLQTRPQACVSEQAAAAIRVRGSTPVHTEALARGFLGLCAGVVLYARGWDACLWSPNLNDNGRPRQAGIAERSTVRTGGRAQLFLMRLLELLVGVLRKRALAMAESAATESLRKDQQKLARPAEQLAAGVVVDMGTGVALGVAAAGAPAVARQLLRMEPRTEQVVRMQAPAGEWGCGHDDRRRCVRGYTRSRRRDCGRDHGHG